MPTFLVTGVLAGEYLPAQPLILDTVAIWHDADGIERIVKNRPEAPIIADCTEAVIIHPAINTKSRWRVDFLLKADGGREALRCAKVGPAPRLLAALSASTSERYGFDLLQAIELDGSPTTIAKAIGTKALNQIGGNESKETTAHLIVVRPLPDDVAKTVSTRFQTLESDAVGARAANYFSFANELTDLVHLNAAVAIPTLTQYFLCIEAIIKAVAPKVSDFDTSQKIQKQQSIVDRLEVSLSNRELKLSKKVKQLRASYRNLQYLEQTTIKDQIRITGNTLDIGSKTTQDAMDFADLRSRYLAHSGSYPNQTQLEHWSGQDRKAQMLAGRFLNAYLDYRNSG